MIEKLDLTGKLKKYNDSLSKEECFSFNDALNIIAHEVERKYNEIIKHIQNNESDEEKVLIGQEIWEYAEKNKSNKLKKYYNSDKYDICVYDKKGQFIEKINLNEQAVKSSTVNRIVNQETLPESALKSSKLKEYKSKLQKALDKYNWINTYLYEDKGNKRVVSYNDIEEMADLYQDVIEYLREFNNKYEQAIAEKQKEIDDDLIEWLEKLSKECHTVNRNNSIRLLKQLEV